MIIVDKNVYSDVQLIHRSFRTRIIDLVLQIVLIHSMLINQREVVFLHVLLERSIKLMEYWESAHLNATQISMQTSQKFVCLQQIAQALQLNFMAMI